MLHAKFLLSPYANARVLRVDTSKARVMTGVADILTWEDEDIKNLVSYAEHWGAPRPWLDNIADQEKRRGRRHRRGGIGGNLRSGAPGAGRGMGNPAAHCGLAQGQAGGFPLSSGLRTAPRRSSACQTRKPPRTRPRRVTSPTQTLSRGDLEEGFKEADHIVEYDLYMPAFAIPCPQPTRLCSLVVKG